jgi:hypothetical protein
MGGSCSINKWNLSNVIASIGDYNSSFIRTQDYDLWIRVANHGGIINIPLFL